MPFFFLFPCLVLRLLLLLLLPGRKMAHSPQKQHKKQTQRRIEPPTLPAMMKIKFSSLLALLELASASVACVELFADMSLKSRPSHGGNISIFAISCLLYWVLRRLTSLVGGCSSSRYFHRPAASTVNRCECLLRCCEQVKQIILYSRFQLSLCRLF